MSVHPASRVALRHKVVALAVSLAALTYLDRVAISVLAPAMMRDFGLTQIQMSYVFSAFTLAYALFEVPTAWWADRVGSRRVVTRIVTWWSAFTVLTGAAWGYFSLIATRFLFGAGEAGAWPNATRVFSRWIPASERGVVQGIFFAGAHLSGGLAPFLVTVMSGHFHWRTIFVIFGALGFLWAAWWYRWFRDEPSEHPSITHDELQKILSERALLARHGGTGSRWTIIFRSRSVFLLCLMYIANCYGFYFLITWLPTYLGKARGFSSMELGLFAGLPLTLSVFGDIFGGWTTDVLTKRFGLRFGRASVGVGAYFVAGVAMVGAAGVEGARIAAVLIAIASAAGMFTLGASWAACIDIGGRHSAVLSAAMNTSGQIGGILSPIVLAYVVDIFDNWAIPLYVMAGLYFMASVCWIFIRADRPLEGHSPLPGRAA